MCHIGYSFGYIVNLQLSSIEIRLWEYYLIWSSNIYLKNIKQVIFKGCRCITNYI